MGTYIQETYFWPILLSPDMSSLKLKECPFMHHTLCCHDALMQPWWVTNHRGFIHSQRSPSEYCIGAEVMSNSVTNNYGSLIDKETDFQSISTCILSDVWQSLLHWPLLYMYQHFPSQNVTSVGHRCGVGVSYNRGSVTKNGNRCQWEDQCMLSICSTWPVEIEEHPCLNRQH